MARAREKKFVKFERENTYLVTNRNDRRTPFIKLQIPVGQSSIKMLNLFSKITMPYCFFFYRKSDFIQTIQNRITY